MFGKFCKVLLAGSTPFVFWDVPFENMYKLGWVGQYLGEMVGGHKLGWVGQYFGEIVEVHSCLMFVLSVLLVVLSGLGLFFRVGLCLFIPPTPSGVWFGNPIVSVGWVHTYSKHCWYISPIAELGWGRLCGCRHLLVFISPNTFWWLFWGFDRGCGLGSRTLYTLLCWVRSSILVRLFPCPLAPSGVHLV